MFLVVFEVDEKPGGGRVLAAEFGGATDVLARRTSAGRPSGKSSRGRSHESEKIAGRNGGSFPHTAALERSSPGIATAHACPMRCRPPANPAICPRLLHAKSS